MVGMSMTAQVPDLPRVSGRHRNRALAQARKAKAVQLRTAGYTYQEIADQLGYANRGAVHNIVSAAPKDQTTEAVEDLRRLQSDRLDALQRELWSKADSGDIAAIDQTTRSS